MGSTMRSGTFVRWHLHRNVVPRSMNDVEQGREAILEMARSDCDGGAPSPSTVSDEAPCKQQLLLELYGDREIEKCARSSAPWTPRGSCHQVCCSQNHDATKMAKDTISKSQGQNN